MASTISGSDLILGTFVDGHAINFTGKALRLGQTSKIGIVSHPTTALAARSGIIPGAGLPLNVVALSSTSVTVKAGMCAFQATTSATDGVLAVTLAVDSVLDTITGDGTNPRIDVVVVEVIVGSLPTIKRVEGTPNATPVRPALTPPAPSTTTWFPLAQLRVEKSSTPGITISKLANVDGVYTCAPGGSVRGATRLYQNARAVDNTIGPSSTGTFAGVTLTAAQCVPGVYSVAFKADFQMTGGSGQQLLVIDCVTPAGTRTVAVHRNSGELDSVNLTINIVFDVQPTTSQSWILNATSGGGTPSVIFKIGSLVEVTRVTDL